MNEQQQSQNQFLAVKHVESKKSKPIVAVNIKTIIKIRPLLNSELKQPECISCHPDGQTIQIKDSLNTIREKVDQVFSKTATQKQLYSYLEPAIQQIREGFNVTILSYGQTGSGKTYTMFGSDWDNILVEKQIKNNKKKQQTFYGNIQSDDNFAGVIPRSIHHIFSKMFKNKNNIQIYCSFLQLYNERIIDLLQQSDSPKILVIHENKTDGIYVQNLTEVKVRDFEECLDIMKRGEKNRVVRQTHMNVKSSRSHTIFQLLIEEVFPSTQSYRRTKLNLCDLAGSEKINKSQEMELEHFKQLKNINLSLTTLGKVIWSLSSRDSSIPAYRQSKLTRLLQDSLGGNTFTNIIANISTKKSTLQQTINTLKFIERARQVKTEVFTKTYSGQPELQEMQKEINYLKGVLKMRRLNNPFESRDMADRIRQLQNENRSLKKIADKEMFNRLLSENTKMKRELQKLGVEQIILNQSYLNENLITIERASETPLDTPALTIKHEDIEKSYSLHTHKKKLGSSQTIDKNSTNTQLPEVKSRYTKYSKEEGQVKSISLNTNIIMRRLQMIERMKVENKERLQKKLSQLEHIDIVANTANSRNLGQKTSKSYNKTEKKNRY